VDGDSPPQDIGVPSKWVFSFSTRGYAQVLLNICVAVQNKKRALCVQVKNKTYVIYTDMYLIPWIQSYGNKTITSNYYLFLIRRGERVAKAVKQHEKIGEYHRLASLT
jgi:hypothetical protein